MKKHIPALILIALLFLSTSNCQKEYENDNNTILDTNFVYKKIAYVKTELGGCHLQTKNETNSTVHDSEDGIIFTVNNDTLDIYLEVFYICCAPFVSETTTSNDSIIIFINDTCSSQYACYCRCACFYSWDFIFADIMEKEYYYKIICNGIHFPYYLSDTLLQQPFIYREGKIDLKRLL